MGKMEKETSLKIKTIYGIITIRFIDLESLDAFTVRYDNQAKLVSSLIDILDLGIELDDVMEVYIYHEYVSRKNLNKSKLDYVKYRNDNFNVDRLGGSLKDYLKMDHSRVLKCGVGDICTKAMADFRAGERDLSNFDIDNAVDKYLTNAPYRTYRKIYFMIKGSVRIQIDSVRPYLPKKNSSLSECSSSDDYIMTLLQKAAKDEFDEADIMDELSRFDLEELRGMITHPRGGVFDGLKTISPDDEADACAFEMCTGVTISQMRKAMAISGFSRGRIRK